LRVCGTHSPLKRDHVALWILRGDTASKITESEGISSGLRVCILSADHVQPSYRQGKYPCPREAAIRVDADTKKDVTYGAGNRL
jgi:hypothetical protein